MTLDEQARALYRAYPRKVARGSALKAIRKSLLLPREKGGVGFDALMESVQEYAEAKRGQESRYIPHPSTWFNQERWADDRTDWWEGRKPEITAEDAWERVRRAISQFGAADPRGAKEWLQDEAIVEAVRTVGWKRLCDMDDYNRTTFFKQFGAAYEKSATNVTRKAKGTGGEKEGEGTLPRNTIPYPGQTGEEKRAS